MTASFIPVFTTYMREKSEEDVWDFANKLFWTLALIGGHHYDFGNGVFTVRGPLVRGKKSRGRSGHRIESRRFPVPVLRGAGLAGHGDIELLPHFWIAGGDTHRLECGGDSVFGERGMETLQESGDGDRGRSSSRRSIAVPDPGADAGAEGNDVQVWNFIFAPRDQECGAIDDSAAFRDRDRADQSAGRYAVRDGGGYASGKPDGVVLGRSRHGIGIGRVRDRGGYGDSADDVASGGGERLRGLKENAHVSRCGSWLSSRSLRCWD